jgi:hypothetical protein
MAGGNRAESTTRHQQGLSPSFWMRNPINNKSWQRSSEQVSNQATQNRVPEWKQACLGQQGDKAATG